MDVVLRRRETQPAVWPTGKDERCAHSRGAPRKVSKLFDAARRLELPEGAHLAPSPGSQSPGLLSWGRMRFRCFEPLGLW